MPYYHVYNRGAHKAVIFNERSDFDRFTALLYIANSAKPFVFKKHEPDIFSYDRTQTLVDIFAYCLMPNHFHIGLATESAENLERFMRKLCTGYVMYYNNKYNHSGTLFQGKYKAKEIDTDRYLSRLVEYIHLNPYGIDKPELASTHKADHYYEAFEQSKKYDHSSLRDYLGEIRLQTVILSTSKVRPWLWTTSPQA